MEPNGQENKHVRESDIFAGLRNIISRMNQRQLILRNRHGKDLMQMPLAWVIIGLVVAFLFHVLPLVAIAVIVLLLTKHQFIMQNRI